MFKEDLIIKVCERSKHVKKEDVKSVIDATIDTIKEAMVSNEQILLKGLFSLNPCKTKARTGYNFKTKEKVLIPERKNYSMKISRSLIKKIND